MNLSRRLFLGGAIALAGAAIIPAQAMPRIVGDGVHDDADGINALIAGKPVSIENTYLALNSDGRIWFNEGGRFLLGKSINLTRDNTLIVGGTFIAAPGFLGPLLVLDVTGGTIENTALIGNGLNTGIAIKASRSPDAQNWFEWIRDV